MDISPMSEDAPYTQYSQAIFREIGHHGGMEGIYAYYPMNENGMAFQGANTFGGNDGGYAAQGTYGMYQGGFM